MRIWKYEIETVDTTIKLPQGARILHAEHQDEVPYMWVLVNPQAPLEDRRFRVVGTGWAVNHNEEYICTWQDPPYVWHLFEIKTLICPHCKDTFSHEAVEYSKEEGFYPYCSNICKKQVEHNAALRKD